MKTQLEERLESLKKEYQEGQQVLTDLQTKQGRLQETLLRISGAIQVLEEELSSAEPSPKPDETPSLGLVEN